MRKLIVLAAACAALPGFASAADLQIRFCPGKQVHAYPLNDARGVQGLLIQNLALINAGQGPAKVSLVQIDLLREGQVIDSRRLEGVDLDRAGKSGKAIDGANMLVAMDFQFCGGTMIPSGGRSAAQPWRRTRRCS